MKLKWQLAGMLVALGWRLAAQPEPVLRVVGGSPAGANLLRNPHFELSSGGGYVAWRAAPQGFTAAPGDGRAGSDAVACDAPSSAGWRGVSQHVTLNRTTPVPLKVSGWSRAEGVEGGRDSGYSIYVDLLYADGTPLWGQTANFTPGTHDWERREILILPEKPVKSLTLYCLFRGHAGKVWFDDVSLSEIRAPDGAFVFQGVPMTRNPAAHAGAGAVRHPATQDGLALEMQGSSVTGVRVGGRRLPGTGPGGFLARDVAANSDLFGFEHGECPELGLRLTTEWESHPDHLAVSGRIQDTRGADRAILLLFALPIDATGWTWDDDIRRRRPIEGTGEFANVRTVGCGTTGACSAYPVAAVHDAESGLALALDLNRPAQYRLVYHAGARQFFIAYDFGLTPDTERFPSAAEFRFAIFRFDPAWGFRAAFDKLMGIAPAAFRVRSPRQGIWMPFTDIATVQGWEDFGFRYHEGSGNVAWDDAHDILSFRYTEPMTWWMPMEPSLPRTEAEALRVRNAHADGPAGRHREMARVSRAAAMFEANGHPALLFRNTPWANGAVWSLNPNPNLPADPNAATVHWNDEVKDRLYGPAASARLDGEYLDSLEGYVTADLNFRREHFRYTTVPLTFATDTHQPALWKGLAVQEFTRWISEDVHRLGGLTFANGVPYRFGFLCPWLDVMGTETNWMPDGGYRPPGDEQLALWRTLSGRKPYLLLMNTDYDRFGPEFVERYFQRCLSYGFFPSMFSHNAAEDPYWKNPAWYNRDRPLFRKYIPLIRRVAEAGWQPVTGAVASNPAIAVERFGSDAASSVFFTLFNPAASRRLTRVQLREDAARLPAGQPARELVTGQTIPWTQDGWPVALEAGGAAVLEVQRGPRFVEVETRPAGRVRVVIATGTEAAPVLEASRDLRAWEAIETLAAAASPVIRELAMQPGEPSRFFRLRW